MIMIRSGGRDTEQQKNARKWPWNLDDNRKKNSQSVNKSPARTTTSSVIRKVLKRSENNSLPFIHNNLWRIYKMYLKKGVDKSGELETTWADFSIPRSYQPDIWKVLQEQSQSRKSHPYVVQHGAKLSQEAKGTTAWTGPHVGTSGEEQL